MQINQGIFWVKLNGLEEIGYCFFPLRNFLYALLRLE